MTLVVLALLAALPQDPPPLREKASAFTFLRAKGWSRLEMANNMVALAPPGPDAQQCSLFIFAGIVGEVNDLVYHDKMLQSVNRGCQAEGKIEKAYRGSWQYTRMKVLNAQGQPQWMALYTGKSDAHREAFYFVAATEELSKAHRFAVEKMILSVEWPDARPQRPSGVNEFVPAPVPDKDKDVKIVGAWTVARLEQTFSVDPKAGGVQQRATVKVFVLFGNQVAAKVDALSTGQIDSTYPSEGLATMNVSDPAKLANDRRYGRWSEMDGKINIKWNQGPEDNVRRDKEDLKEANGTLWSAIKSLDGLRLDGTWEREIPIGSPYRITLRKNGTFDADQVNEVMGGQLVNKKFPELGSGTYEFRKWSLILRFETGFVQSIQVMFDSGDPETAKSILIAGYPFNRTTPAKGR
jgi:hypothetical protein